MLHEYLERFLLSKRSAGLSKATTDWYSIQIRQFADWIDAHPAELVPETMERYLVYLRDRDLAPSSVAGAHRALKIFFKWCKERGIYDHSPMDGIKIKKPKRSPPKRATRGEFEKLVRFIPVDSWIGLRDYLLVHTLFYCGLRIGEACRLELAHFDLENSVLFVPDGKTGAGVVPLLKPVIEAFLAYQLHRPQWRDDRVFLSSDGDTGIDGVLTPSGARQMLIRRCREAGIRYLNPHSFRHGIAMHLLNDQRADASVVQRILRHSKITTTTDNYAEWLIDKLGDEYRKRMKFE